MGKVAVLTFFGLMALMIWAAIASLTPQASQALVHGISSAEQLISEAEDDTEVLEAPADLDPYIDLPMTSHALEGHASDRWNATSIRSYFSNGSCYPQIYYCEAQDFEVHYCQLDDGKKSIALVVGIAVKQIITGFMADTTYWQNRCQ